MKSMMYVSIILIIVSACTTKSTDIDSIDPFVDPVVMSWYEKNQDNPEALIPVLISSDGKLDDKYPLRLVADNYYTGRVSINDLKGLMYDKKVVRINSGKSKKHNQDH